MVGIMGGHDRERLEKARVQAAPRPRRMRRTCRWPSWPGGFRARVSPWRPGEVPVPWRPRTSGPGSRAAPKPNCALASASSSPCLWWGRWLRDHPSGTAANGWAGLRGDGAVSPGRRGSRRRALACPPGSTVMSRRTPSPPTSPGSSRTAFARRVFGHRHPWRHLRRRQRGHGSGDFQDACQNYYATRGAAAPMVLPGTAYWNRDASKEGVSNGKPGGPPAAAGAEKGFADLMRLTDDSTRS